MKKMFKLPLFLGVVGAACALILAGVNAFTAPVIAKNESNKKAQAYIEVFANSGITITKDDIEVIDAISLSDELYNNGCSGKAIVASQKGIVYDFSATGYGGKFSFQVAFANGKYIGFSDISNGETPGFGATLLANLAGGEKAGCDAANAASEISSLISGKSKTGTPLVNAVSLAYADYAEWYATVK